VTYKKGWVYILYPVFIFISVEAFILRLFVYGTIGTPYTANSPTVREMPLNDLNVGVVCAFSTWSAIELLFLMEVQVPTIM